MAFDVTGLTDYARPASEMLRDNVLFSDNFKRYNFQTGVRYQDKIDFLNTEVVLQAGGCKVAANGDTTINEKMLTVARLGTHNEYCYADLDKTSVKADSTLEATVINSILDNLKVELNRLFWVGDKAGTDLIDGITTEALADVNVVTVTKAAPTLTTIITYINELITNMPDKMRKQNGNLTIHTSMALWTMYRQALALTPASLLDYNGKEMGEYEMWVFAEEGNITIKGEPGFPNLGTARMLLAADNNIFIGTDELQNVSSLRIVYNEKDNDFSFISDFTYGVTYLFSDQIIIMEDV